MKAGIMIGMIVAAIIAGGAGGFVVTELVAGDDRQPAVAENNAQLAPPPRADRPPHDPQVNKLLTQIEDLERKLERRDREHSHMLAEELGAVNERIDELESGTVSLKGGEVETGESVEADVGNVKPEVLDRAVSEAIERREEARRQEQREEFRERMERRNENERDRVVATLKEKLSLTGVQEVNVKAKLEEYQTKRGDLFRKFRESRENNEEFDFRAERAKLESETKAAIENDVLTLSQVSTFRELVGEDGQVSNIGQEERRRGGFRGFGGRD